MLNPAEIATGFINTGIKKTTLTTFRMLCLGVMAGIFIAFAGAGSAIAGCTATDPSLSRIFNAAVFPSGLIMVILAGSELFTGNCLIIISALEKKISISAMLKNWIIVYAGNLIGSLLIALAFVYSHVPDMFNEELANLLVSTAVAKTELGFADAFLKGILCNILVCIAVWIAAASTEVQGKVMGLYMPIAVFVLCGFEHCVANMFSIPAGIFTAGEYGILADSLNWIGFIENMIPVTLGNITGGCMVGAGYWFIYLKGTRN